ncbi:hypothetical protein [Sandaracinus amylolyticus]|nr:hypothetical protein [Sandaracinus amylolyticus]
MRTWGFRILRATFMAIVAWLLYQVLDHYDRAWLFVPIAIGVLALWLAEQARRAWTRKKKEADWDRWESAVVDASLRPRAIIEVKQALARSQRLGPRLRQEQAHLSVVLAELLDASGRPEEGARVLARVDLDALSPSQAVVVRHTKIASYLSAGMIDDAQAALAVRGKASDEPDMEARLDLLGGMIAVERGELDDALKIATDVEARLEDASVKAEARVLRAAALDARGDHEGAITTLRTLDDATLLSLEMLGFRRVRGLAAEARAPIAGASEDQPGER